MTFTVRSAFLAALALSLVVAGCGGGETLPRPDRSNPDPEVMTSEIRGGTTDNGHPAVALLYNNSQGYLCSGTMIAPRVYLTAGHCVEPDSNAGHYEVGGGTDPFNAADWVIGASAVHEHPNYDPTDFGIHDIGILILDSDAPVTPMAWQQTVNNSVYAVGEPFTAVGYGKTNEITDDSGIKRKVNMTIAQTGSDAFAYGGPTANICSGDSGGPDIAAVGGVDTVIGIHSYGDTDCLQVGVSDRTDDNASFIAQYMPATGDDDDDTGSDKGCGCDLSGAGTSSLAGLAPLCLAALATLAVRRRKSAERDTGKS